MTKDNFCAHSDAFQKLICVQKLTSVSGPTNRHHFSTTHIAQTMWTRESALSLMCQSSSLYTPAKHRKAELYRKTVVDRAIKRSIVIGEHEEHETDGNKKLAPEQTSVSQPAKCTNQTKRDIPTLVDASSTSPTFPGADGPSPAGLTLDPGRRPLEARGAVGSGGAVGAALPQFLGAARDGGRRLLSLRPQQVAWQRGAPRVHMSNDNFGCPAGRSARNTSS